METQTETSTCPFCQTAVSQSLSLCPHCKYPIGGTEADQNQFQLKWKEVEVEYNRLETRLTNGTKWLRVVAIVSVVSIVSAFFRIRNVDFQLLPTEFHIWLLVKVFTAALFALFAFSLAKRAPKPVYAVSIIYISTLLIWQLFQLFGLDGAVGYFGYIVLPFCVWHSFRAYKAAEKIDFVTLKYQELQALRKRIDSEGV